MSELSSDISLEALETAQIEIPNFMAVRCLARSIQNIARQYNNAKLEGFADKLAEISVSIERGDR